MNCRGRPCSYPFAFHVHHEIISFLFNALDILVPPVSWHEITGVTLIAMLAFLGVCGVLAMTNPAIPDRMFCNRLSFKYYLVCPSHL